MFSTLTLFAFALIFGAASVFATDYNSSEGDIIYTLDGVTQNAQVFGSVSTQDYTPPGSGLITNVELSGHSGLGITLNPSFDSYTVFNSGLPSIGDAYVYIRIVIGPCVYTSTTAVRLKSCWLQFCPWQVCCQWTVQNTVTFTCGGSILVLHSSSTITICR